MNFKKMSTKALSVFMSLIMLFSVCAPLVSAADHDHAENTEKIDINYVSLGDSMANGFGLPGYDYEDYTKANGYLQIAEDAYPSRFAAYLANGETGVKPNGIRYEGAFANVNLYQLAVSSMRVEDLVWILNVDEETLAKLDDIEQNEGGKNYFKNTEFTAELAEEWGCDKYTWVEFLGRRLWEFRPNGEVSATDAIKEYQNAIVNADIITVGAGNANFGVFMLHRLVASMGLDILGSAYHAEAFTEDFDLEALLAKCDEPLVKGVEKLREELKAVIGSSVGNFVDIDEALDIVIYTTVSFCLSYGELLDTINTLNPEAEITIVGLMKTVDGMNYVRGNGEVVDLDDDIMATALGFANAYIAGYATVKQATSRYDNTIYYAEVPTVETIVANYENYLRPVEGEINDVVRDRFVQSIAGDEDAMVWSTLGYTTYLTLDDVKEFEANRAAYAAANPEMAKLIVVYLAFEDAVIKATKNEINLDFASASALKDLPSVFTEELMNSLVPSAEDITAATLAHLQAGAKKETEADPVEFAIFKQIFPVVAGTISDMATGEDAEAAAQATMLIGLITEMYAQNNLNKNIREFFKDYGRNGREAVIEKAIEAAIEIAWNSQDTQDKYNETVAMMTATGMTEDLAKEAAKAAVMVVVKAEVEAQRTTIEAAVDTLFEGYATAYTVYIADVYASEALLADTTVSALVNIFGRTLIGNGLGGHPSEAGHEALFNSVKNAYVEGHTVLDETVDNIIIVRDFIYENYKEIYAYIYKFAEKEGVIAEIDAKLVEAIEAIRYAENWANGYEEYFRSEDFADQITNAANDAVATVEAIRVLVAEADQLDDETYANLIALLAQLEADLNTLATLISVAIDDAIAYGAPIVEAEVARVIAAINAKVNAVLETIAYIEAKVQEQIATAKAMIAKFIATAEAYFADYVGKAEDTAGKIAEMNAYLKNLLNAFLANDAFAANYTVTADSYYLAIGGDDALYAKLLAEKMGLGDDQFSAVTWNNLDASVIAKADLITIGYTESMISGFATEQIFGYVAEYIDGTLRVDVNEFADALLEHLLGQIPAINADAKEMIKTELSSKLNGTFDGILAEEVLAGAATAEMDWAALVGEENVHYIEEAIEAITDALIEAGLPETASYTVDVYELAIESIKEMDPVIATYLSFFDEAELKAMFGEYANYTVVIPVADAIAFAVESYLYSYVQFNFEYAQLVYAVNAINPNAQIVLLGNYNAFAGLGLDFVVNGVTIDLGDIFTSDVQNSANSYANEVFEKIFVALDYATDGDTIDSVLGSVDSSIVSGATALQGIIADVLADAEALRDYVNGTEIGLPELNVPVCPEIEAIISMLDKINFNALADVDWEALVGFDAVEYVAAAAEAIENAVAEVEAILVELGLLETYTITLPTLDLIYANLDKFDAETVALIESLDQAELRAMLGDLADYVVEVKVATNKAVEFVNGLYEQVAEIEIPVFDGISIDMGEILSAPTSIHSLFYAFTMKNVIFVDISDAEIALDAESIEEFLAAYLFDTSVANVTEAGHAYIAEQIYNALNVVCGHGDADKNHVCDYCGETLSVCADNDNDHFCDYCGESITECVDNNNDHLCDSCGKEISVCADANNDHKCDVCGNELTTCTDANNDHKCDVCGATTSNCADANNDHKCDVCGTTMTNCADANNDHKCDVCGTTMTNCTDANNDHKCDVCGTTMTECVDANNDHKCDICGTTMTECADANNDHKCDVCGTTMTECADANNDHKCDLCGTTMTECVDANNDHNCDLCGTAISECADGNNDHNCDICGTKLSDCTFGEWVTTKEATKKEEGERQRTCTVCGAVETEVIAQLEGLSTGAVVAIATGSVAVVSGAGVAAYWFIFRKKKLSA